LVGQVVGVALIWCVYAFLNDLFKPSQELFALLGMAAGLFTYSMITVMSLRLLHNSNILTILSDGTVIYKPAFKIERLKFSPGLQWRREGRSVRISDPADPEVGRTFALPANVRV
jgi:hypothetical protein